MLSKFVRTEAGRRRHEATLIGPFLDGFLGWRNDAGFAYATVRADLRCATAFGEYLHEVGISQVSEVTETTLREFIGHYCTHPRRLGPARSTPGGGRALEECLVGSTRALIAYLRQLGAVPTPEARVARPYDKMLETYVRYLRCHRGLADITVEQHRYWCDRILEALTVEDELSLADLSVEKIEAAFRTLSQGIGQRSRQIMTTSVLALLRYLRGSGQVPSTCRPFLPRRRKYALSTLPSVIPWADVERAIAALDRTTPMGMRDFAIMQLVAAYGLRASEVAGLQLDDVDWRGWRLTVKQTKTRRALELPLLRPVHAALVSYIREGRPDTSCRHVFLKCQAPRGPATRATIYCVVRRTLKNAGVSASHYGPHALRHARASQLLRSGQSLKSIGDILGHRVPEATFMYCKIDVETLRKMALEVPEVRS